MPRLFVSRPRTPHEKERLEELGIVAGTAEAQVSLRKIRNIKHAQKSRALQRDRANRYCKDVDYLLSIIKTERAMHAQTQKRLIIVETENEQLKLENTDLKLLSLDGSGVGATLEVCSAAPECRLQYPF